MLKIRGEQHIDYFRVVCDKCGKQTKNEYGGRKLSHGGSPAFRARCDDCQDEVVLKLWDGGWTGLPFDPASTSDSN